MADFNLLDFAQALEERDIDYQASHDAFDATIRIINLDNRHPRHRGCTEGQRFANILAWDQDPTEV